MKGTVFALAFGFAALGVSTRASAQDLGSKGDAIFGAERVFGIRGERWEIDNPAPAQNDEFNATTISLGFARPALFTYNIPRIAFDYAIIDKLTIGGAILYSNLDAEDEDGDDVSISDFEFSPRVGYLHMFGKVIGIWPRGGLAYQSTTAQNVFHEWTLGLNLECMFPIVVREHFGFEVGFTFDQSLLNNYDPENGPERDITVRSFGLQAGLFGWI